MGIFARKSLYKHMQIVSKNIRQIFLFNEQMISLRKSRLNDLSKMKHTKYRRKYCRTCQQDMNPFEHLLNVNLTWTLVHVPPPTVNLKLKER